MSGSTVLLLHIWHLFTYPCSVWSMHVSWCMCGSERQLSGPVLIPSCDSRVPTKAVSIGSECPYSLSHPSQHPFTPHPAPTSLFCLLRQGHSTKCWLFLWSLPPERSYLGVRHHTWPLPVLYTCCTQTMSKL